MRGEKADVARSRRAWSGDLCPGPFRAGGRVVT